MKLGVAAVFALVLFGTSVALAQDASPLDVAARQAILVESATGDILFAKDADTQMAPSSMSKVMTMYLVFDALKQGKLNLEDTLPVSQKAWQQEGSRMFVNAGDRVKVEDLVRGVIVQSGNDAAVVLAEGLGSGSESAFADMENEKAKQLGMTNSHFVNATGLPDPQHYSTAHDLAILAAAIQHDFPEYYHYFSELNFTYNGISQGNRNPLLYRNMNVDGLKTGHTEVGGFGLTASCMRDGRRLTLVLNGMEDMQARADESAKVLDYGYREFGLYPIIKAGDVLAAPAIWLGEDKSVNIVASKDAVLSLSRASRSGLKAVASFEQPIAAPVVKGQQLGVLTITAPGKEMQQIPLVAAQDVAQIGFFARLWAKLGLLLGKG